MLKTVSHSCLTQHGRFWGDYHPYNCRQTEWWDYWWEAERFMWRAQGGAQNDVLTCNGSCAGRDVEGGWREQLRCISWRMPHANKGADAAGAYALPRLIRCWQQRCLPCQRSTSWRERRILGYSMVLRTNSSGTHADHSPRQDAVVSPLRASARDYGACTINWRRLCFHAGIPAQRFSRHLRQCVALYQ